MAPPAGPRGITIADVQRVAESGSKAMPPAEPQFKMPTPNELMNYLVGGPQSGYGKKYGGLGTQTALNNAIKGNVYNYMALIDALNQQLGTQASGLETTFQQTQKPSTVEDQLRRQLADLQAQREALPYQTMFGDPTQMDNPFRAEPRREQLPDIFGSSILRDIQSAKDEAARNDIRAAAEADLNKQESDTARRLAAASQSRYIPALEQRRAGYRALEPMVQFTEQLGATTPSELAQLVATRQFGVNPAVAAGQFGPGFDIQIMGEQEKYAQLGQPDVNKTTAELVFEQMGPEGLQQYQDQIVLNAMNGTIGDQMAAQEELNDVENVAYDQEINAALGFTPGAIYANKAQAEQARGYLLDANFQEQVQTSMADAAKRIADGNDPDEVLTEIYTNYYTASGDPIGANILADVVAQFTFGS